jgi:nucleotide-binding universal stress UspA family protein
MTHCPPRRILAAVDFGDASAAAVALAGRLASRFRSTLIALHAETFDVPPYFTREQFARIEGELRAGRGIAEASLRRFVATHTDAAATVRVVDRPPVEAVLEEAAGADLVVMGTHGRSGPKRWWLGSVAERVLRETPVPVLVVRAVPAMDASAVREVVVLTGTSAPELNAWAAAVALALDSTVRQGPSVDRCDAVTMTTSSVLAVPLESAGAGRHVNPNVVSLARTCPAPVLFVPTRHPEATPA